MSFPTPPNPTPPPLLTSTVPLSLSNPNGGTIPNTDGSNCVTKSENALLQIFDQLITDSNSIIVSRYQMQADSDIWNFLSEEIAFLVHSANSHGTSADQRSLIYGQIMLIITSQYLPAVSNFLGDQIGEQAAIQNMSSDISAFIIEAETGFNSLSSTPDCNCPAKECDTAGSCPGCTESTDCVSDYNFFSGIMTLVAGTNESTIAPDTGPGYSFTFTATLQTSYGTTTSSEQNVLGFLTDTTIWGNNNTPLSTTEASQISTALLGIATIFNPTVSSPTTDGNVALNAWSEMNLSNIASSICSWTQPYGSNGSAGVDDPIATGNAPLVWTQPATVQADLNTAAQTIEGVATSTQTIENFQVQEIDQFYGITNSIQMSQEQQCASMVKQQTT